MIRKNEIKNDLAVLNKKLKKISTTYKKEIKVNKYQDKEFLYSNIFINNLYSKEEHKVVIKVLKKELKEYFKKYELNEKSSILVVGLGNINNICDSLGAKVVNNVKASAHLKTLNKDLDIRKVYTLIHGSTSARGFSAFLNVKACVNLLKPDCIIVIDSLVCSNLKYLNKVIQLTDRGIIPGSGLYSYQEEISLKTLNTPVIVIGVATVIELLAIIKNTCKIKEENIFNMKNLDFYVSSKDIDVIINNLSQIISKAINEILNTFKSL